MRGLILERSQSKVSFSAQTVKKSQLSYKNICFGEIMEDDNVKDAALKQAQEAYGLFLSFMKWVAYIFIGLVIVLAFFNFFDDPTGSRHLPEEISDQYDPSGLSKKEK